MEERHVVVHCQLIQCGLYEIRRAAKIENCVLSVLRITDANCRLSLEAPVSCSSWMLIEKSIFLAVAAMKIKLLQVQ